jgi:hypothetical protein
VCRARALRPGAIEGAEKKGNAGKITGGNAEDSENKRLAKIAIQNVMKINGLEIDEGRGGETLGIAEVPHTPGVLRKEFGFA